MKIKQYDKQSSKIEYFGETWTGLSGGSESQLEDALYQSYGKAQIGKDRTVLVNTEGVSAVPLREGVDFAYGKRLDASTNEDPTDGFGTVAGGIIDTGASGALTKPLRILNGTKNIKDVTGLNLKIFAYNLSVDTAPPSDRIYVDPIKNKVLFPRPIWNKKFNTSLEAKDINEGIDTGQAEWGNMNAFYAKGAVTGGKFGNRSLWNYYDNTQAYRWRNGLDLGLRGSASYWTMIYAANQDQFCFTLLCINGVTPSAYYSPSTNMYSLAYNETYGPPPSTLIQCDAFSQGMTHVFIAWDSQGLTGGATFKVWVNGGLLLNVNPQMIKGGSFFETYIQPYYGGNAYTCFEDAIIWNYPIEDPSFIYNGGAGRQTAFHPIYGATDGYKPSTIKAGFFYKGDSTLPATLPKPSAGANVQVQLEAVTDYNNGVGYFGAGHKIYDTDYSVLTEETDFYYDEAWDGTGTHAIDKYDDGVSGALADQKVIRVVNDISGVAKNITDAAGLNLKPVCKEMITDNYSPPVGEFYIDPVRGKVVLPRPSLWLKCESALNMASPEILTSGFTVVDVGFMSFPAGGKFGNFMHIINPSGRSGVVGGAQSKGTISCYFSVGVATSYEALRSLCRVHLTDIFSFGLDMYSNGGGGFINNSAYIGDPDGAKEVFSIEVTSMIHFYAVWDSSKGLTGGKALRVFLNGTERFTTTTNMLNLTPDRVSITGSATTSAWANIDNIKVWNTVVSEDPSFEYNGGTGREDALHPVYGATNGYKPKLTGVGGVGYNKASGAGSLVRGKI